MAVYKVRLSADEANEALPPSEAGDEYPVFQGDDVAITFWVDEERRLRKLVVEYKLEDRTRTVTAVIEDFGSDAAIDVPPKEEIFDE